MTLRPVRPAPETTPADEPVDEQSVRQIAQPEQRAVGRRRRLSSVGEGQIADAAQRVVNRESNDILNAAKKFARRPDGLADFRKWLNDFLDNHQPVVVERLWSATWSLAQLAADEAHTEAQEAGHEGELDEDGLRRFAEDYMGSRATGWVAMLRSDLYDGLDRAEASGTRVAEPDPAWLNETEAVIEKRKDSEADSWGRDEFEPDRERGGCDGLGGGGCDVPALGILRRELRLLRQDERPHGGHCAMVPPGR